MSLITITMHITARVLVSLTQHDHVKVQMYVKGCSACKLTQYKEYSQLFQFLTQLKFQLWQPVALYDFLQYFTTKLCKLLLHNFIKRSDCSTHKMQPIVSIHAHTHCSAATVYNQIV
jgi:hypothetical protein